MCQCKFDQAFRRVLGWVSQWSLVSSHINGSRGLQRWHQHKEHGNHERGGSSRDKKGPIVTHYPPPPPAIPATPYGPSPPPPYPLGVTPPPPPPATPQGYSPAGYPPNPYPGGYQPPPPPSHYGQYPAPPPPPPQYAQPSPYGQPSYPPAQYPPTPGYYAPGAAPPPAPPPSHYPPGTYPPPQYGLPPPPPPSSAAYPPQPSSTPYPPHYPPQPPPPPPPGAFHYPPSQPPPYPPPQPQYSPPPGWAPPHAGPPPTPHSANQTPLGGHRGRHQKNQGSKRSQHHRDKNRQPNEKHGKGGPRHERRGRRPSRGEQQIKTDDSQTSTEDPKRPNQYPPEEAAGGKEEKNAPALDSQIEEDLRLVFPEIKTNPADPVGIPIPVEYNDDPTIPPAYNATCVKSEFFQEDNQKDFVRSIREHPSWSTLRDDPVFKHYPGMATRHFPDRDHEYPSYDPSEPPPSPSAIKLPPRFKIDRSSLRAKREGPDEDRKDGRSSNAQHHSPRDRQRRDLGRDRLNGDDRDERRPRKRSFDASLDNGRDDRDLKRNRRWSQHQRNGSLDTHNRAVSPHQRSMSPPRFNFEGDPWSLQAGETNPRPSSGRHQTDVSTDPKHSPRREERISYADKRHDSGYHSGQSIHKSGARYRDDDHRERRNSDRSHRKYRSPSRSRSRSRSRGPYRSRTRVRSRATTPSRSDRSRSESPLDDLEAGLLGLVREPSEPRSKPVAKKPIKRVKVAAAFEYASLSIPCLFGIAFELYFLTIYSRRW